MQNLPIHSDSQSVPVYDCHVLITKLEDGNLAGTVSNLPEVTATASNERDLLRKISTEFKSRVMEYGTDQKKIPWEEVKKPGPGQQQRWIPVHL